MSKHLNHFLSLPRELTLVICEELDWTDQKHIRLTCKTLANLAASLVLSHIFISSKIETTIEELISDLQSLTNPESATVNCSVEITLGDLLLKLRWFTETDIDRSKTDIMVSEALFTALTSFKMVQTVNWNPGLNDPLSFQDLTWKAIGLLPNLRHLTICSFFLWRPPPHFDSLSALESITVFGDIFNHDRILTLSKLYAASPNLNSITIDNFVNTLCPVHKADGVQQSCPKRNPSDPLRCLTLSNIPLCVDDISLPHLTYLTSFKLSSLKYVEGSHPHDIWIAFKRSKIRLEELEVGYGAMADSLNDYLASYSGLKKLRMIIPESRDRASSEASGTKFWSDGFPNHIDTIQDFSLQARYGDQWCFGTHNYSLLEKCTKFKQLTLSLPGKADFKEVDTLFDMVAHMPLRLKELGLVVPARDIHRGDSFLNLDFERLMVWVLKYMHPPSCQSLPRLTVNTYHVFVGFKDSQLDRLRYCRSG